MKNIDRLLEKPCFIIDYLPYQVPKDSSGQFLKIENYLLNNYERYGIKDKFIRIILKVMCYHKVSVRWGKWIEQPAPGIIEEIIDTIMKNHSGYTDILLTDKDVLMQFEWDCLNISVYNPDDEMCELFEKIAASEGMFWRKSS